MTCRDFQCQALLLRSGELAGETDRSALHRHLRACAACAAFAADLDRLHLAADAALRRGDPSPSSLARIRAEAQLALGLSPGPAPVHPRFRAPILALAAALTLLLAGLFVLHRMTADPQPPDLRANLPPTPPPAATVEAAAEHDLAAIFEDEHRSGIFQPLFQDDCFTIEQAAELVRQDQVTRLELDIMFLEGLAI